jgi:ABC-type phosphate transport system substrate-binding protein
MTGTALLRRIVCLMCGVWPFAVHADVLVIAHPDSPIPQLSARQVSDLYLGRIRHLPLDNAAAPTPISLYEQPDSPLRESFFRSLNGMSITQLNAYWARLRFSGEVLPPLTLSDSRTVIEKVSGDRHAIGYIDATALPAAQKYKIVLRLKE